MSAGFVLCFYKITEFNWKVWCLDTTAYLVGFQWEAMVPIAGVFTKFQFLISMYSVPGIHVYPKTEHSFHCLLEIDIELMEFDCVNISFLSPKSIEPHVNHKIEECNCQWVPQNSFSLFKLGIQLIPNSQIPQTRTTNDLTFCFFLFPTI